ncbi:sensor histidine kinase [Microbacterium sp. ZW T5_56]|uniref:sensor histidine kinase n=1 Tax=Microbacterium sp. ZW T5_56 TaxID=3378081 RepID=UPI0038536460
MTQPGHTAARSSRDSTWVRRSTAASLYAIIAVGAGVAIMAELMPGDPRSVTLAALTVISAGAMAASVLTVVRRPKPRSATHPALLLAAALSTIAWAAAIAAPFAGWGWGFMLAVAGGIIASVLRARWAACVIAVTIGLLATGAVTAFRGISPAGPGAEAYVMLATLGMFVLLPTSAMWALRVVLRLETARQVATELAIAQERLRFATDLHDIQGHHLQVIALKSELAERLLEQDPERAADEVAQIRAIAREALEDTRAVVNDYRSVTLTVEARNAAAVLRSAAIDCEVALESTGLDPQLETLFAVALREATTNILRHSSATRAKIRLQFAAAGWELTVGNDGAGATKTGGTGLSGLRNRVAPFGGSVTAHRDGEWFEVIVSIPRPDVTPSEVNR